MNDAELYQKSNTLQRRDALLSLQEYGKKIQWKNDDRVIDIGCGDGGVTTDILKKFIPSGFKKLTGCDISSRMVDYANTHHGDARTSFSVVDIGSEVSNEMKGAYDHAFSFYTLHWILDQERAFTNIFEILSEGGDCLLIFLGRMPLFDIFRSLSRRATWQRWLVDVDRFVSPYHDSQEPEKDVKRMMAKIGFKHIDVQCKHMSFVYEKVDVLKKAVSAINPFKIPAELQEEFLEDYIQEVRDMRLIDEVNNNLNEPVSVRTNYSLIVAYGRK